MKNIEDYKKLEYKVILEYKSQDHVYVARFPELPGCIAHGDTPQIALNCALQAKDDWLETALESGWSIPEPSETPETSGRITVRIPKYMHKQLIDRTEEEGVSLNQLILSFIGQGLEKKTQEHAWKEMSIKQDEIIAFLAERQGTGAMYHHYVPVQLVGITKTMLRESIMLKQSGANSVSNVMMVPASAGINAAVAGSFFIGEEEKTEPALAKVPTFDEYDKNYQTGGCLYET